MVLSLTFLFRLVMKGGEVQERGKTKKHITANGHTSPLAAVILNPDPAADADTIQAL